MQVSLRKLGLFRMKMGRETEPHHPTKKNNLLNWLDESFGFLLILVFFLSFLVVKLFIQTNILLSYVYFMTHRSLFNLRYECI